MFVSVCDSGGVATFSPNLSHLLLFPRLKLPLYLPSSPPDGLDLLHGPRGHTPIAFPYSAVSMETQAQWRLIEEFQEVPFAQWNLRVITAWMEATLGECCQGQRLLCSYLLSHALGIEVCVLGLAI